VTKGGTAWVAIAKQLQLSQWDATAGGATILLQKLPDYLLKKKI
jgi:hypothetical protein